MFGKRKSTQQPQPAEPPRAHAKPARTVEKPPPSDEATFGTVIVRRSVASRAKDPSHAHEVVQEIVAFVNAVSGEGLYERSEIPASALQAYHADFYLAQVNNGGHSQFIANSGRNLAHVLSDVRAGLVAMQAKAHLSVFEQMAAWVAQNPDEVPKQTGFEGGRAPHLDRLDKQFYEAERASPMAPQSARWIASWPELKLVDDADYAEAMRRTLLMNPLRDARLMSRSVASLLTQTTDWFHVGIGLACASMSPRELKLALGGGMVMEIEGQQQTAFLVRTNAPSPRLCVVTKDYAAAYERVEPNNPPMPALGDVEGMRQAIRDGRLAQYKSPTAGKKLSHVEARMIAGVIELANQYRAAPALDLLLRHAAIDPNGAVVAPMGIDVHPNGPIVNWIVAAGGQPLFAMSTPHGSVLVRPDDNHQIANVRKHEIEEHAARVAAPAKPN
jgi:hypothetical protein